MSSTRAIEATLPFYPPEGSGEARDSDHSDFAVYSLVPQNDAGRQSLLHDLNTGDMANGFCCLAPSPDFADRTIRDVYDYHIEAAKQDDNSMHPHFFIVADKEDWKKNGVLVVYLLVDRSLHSEGDGDEDGFEFVVGVGRCSVDEADCVGCNLDIANVGWDELKESWQRDGWDDDDCYTNKRYFKYHHKTGEEN
ncbi:unnamed protein product [Aureobasidium pullulans]|uniref:Uncharacterized protein n=2 Tax=Aureobasidium pullulans TaxID=5580 RepID=A0A4S8XNZ7_AURPU|nr:hypothetical protein D6D21_07003 [Aureobasidium pullulans]THY43741.1 hypothetical protein D6C97_09155 [Aureobasidium pullulans]THZ44450.1 hypothetical protein D6C90_04771 [Aureobasidium pullulans]CAD0021443.1 unnamed protein product [Aureobasidium pullulans]